ncbi:glycosyltransferase involved in cell wall biosynthesis [Aeromicrobium sp. SORGH_AS981]|uniref:glycosyltransferase family 4 protein n=1 Tax=Aeromicrobium sp. SORGH_AS_0981 TaxID=3041802 RepID=UPI002855CEFA|nr:glycosyltransferase family 1 protein [Aeromicrobium sp. SORGH_AS_0981]MDR6117558.1 glycosyltransferase involved in cell wall biosynthesis [Aeromicrobium sp. SORGH_AS_0981]
MSRLLVDDRYTGQHGIGRYAREVLSRLSIRWEPLGLGGHPASPLDALRSLKSLEQDQVIYSPGYAAFASRRHQILTLHDLIHLETSWPGRAKYNAYYNLVIRPRAKQAGLVFTVSSTSEEAIRRWIGDDSVHIVNTGNACSDAFSPGAPREEPAVPYILFVGNLRAHKNFPIVLKILAALERLEARVLVPLGERASGEALASAAGVSTRIRWLSSPSDEQLAEEYRGATATLVPSSTEGFGLPALESVSCGTPVVHWRGCPALSEASLGCSVTVSELDDIEAWVEAVTELLEHPTRVTPPSRPTWDEVAGRVDVGLQRALERR